MAVAHEDLDSVFAQATAVATGNITVGAAVPGWQVFPASADGQPVSYRTWLISNPAEWENGRGVYNDTAKTITRTNSGVTAGTAGKGVRTNFTSGPKYVQAVALAGDIIGVEVAVAYSTTIAWNIALAQSARTTLTGDATINATVNLPAGTIVRYTFVQGGTGGHVVTLGTGFVATTAIPLRLAVAAVTTLAFKVTGSSLSPLWPDAATTSRAGLATAAQVAAQLVPSTDVKTANFAALAGVMQQTDTSGGGFEATFPAVSTFPAGVLPVIGLLDSTGSWSAATPVILRTADGATIDGFDVTANDYKLDVVGSSVVFALTSGTTWQRLGLGGLAGVPGGGGTWGSITGTLSSQTDLQAALDAKAPSASPTLSNPTFTGTVIVPDGALAIADTSGLQAALDAKQADLDVPSQAEAEAGTATTERVWTALRVAQAIAALAPAVDRPTRTITADGDTNLLTSDAWGTLEFANGGATADQRLVLPDISGFTRGQVFRAIAQADDTVAFPVFIAPAVADQMRSQPQTPGHDPTLDEVQLGVDSSEYAAAEIEVGASKWMVRGHVRALTPALAPDQFGSLIQWHDALAATITDDGGGKCSSWAQRAGLAGAYAQGTSGNRPTIVGTPGAADYGLRFDATNFMTFAQTNGWTADAWSLFLVFNANASFDDFKDLWNSDVSYANTPRLSVFTGTSPVINCGIDTATVDATLQISATRGAGLAVVLVGTSGSVKTYKSDSLNRPVDAYTTSTWTAARTRNIGINTTAASNFLFQSVAEFNAALNADEAMSLIRYARDVRGWVA